MCFHIHAYIILQYSSYFTEIHAHHSASIHWVIPRRYGAAATPSGTPGRGPALQRGTRCLRCLADLWFGGMLCNDWCVSDGLHSPNIIYIHIQKYIYVLYLCTIYLWMNKQIMTHTHTYEYINMYIYTCVYIIVFAHVPWLFEIARGTVNQQFLFKHY